MATRGRAIAGGCPRPISGWPTEDMRCSASTSGGSTGLGKAFVNAANLEGAGKMHDDLIDGVDWAIARGVADPTRVAIYGGSYGGYSALVGLPSPRTSSRAPSISSASRTWSPS
jgi:dipeptidyl aminopeptidase/acylaminoacyl peptidase